MAHLRRRNWIGATMSGIERVERGVRIGAGVTVIALLWLMQGGEELVSTPTPASGLLVHMLFFFFFTGACLLGWKGKARLIAIVLFGIAVLAEAGQMVFPNRDFSYYDLTGNVIGVLLGCLFFITLRRFSRRID